MDKLFSNIGGKLKDLAKVQFVLLLIAAIVSGIAILASESAIGLVVIILGSLLAWVSSWSIYAFGELVEKVSEIESNTWDEEKRKEKQRISKEKKKLEETQKVWSVTQHLQYALQLSTEAEMLDYLSKTQWEMSFDDQKIVSQLLNTPKGELKTAIQEFLEKLNT